MFSRHKWPLIMKPVPAIEEYRAFLKRWGRKANTIDTYIQGIQYFYACLDNYMVTHGLNIMVASGYYIS